MTRIILPKDHVTDVSYPLFFLAGPIRGAMHWQYDAMDHLISLNPDITIASPRRTLREDLEQYRIRSGSEFPRQRAWERHYLDIAARHGAILFWLPGEVEHRCEKAFGAMTRFELGQWITRYRFDPTTRLVIGSNGEFSEISTIAFDTSLDAPDKRIYNSLDETCEAAMELARLQ